MTPKEIRMGLLGWFIMVALVFCLVGAAKYHGTTAGEILLGIPWASLMITIVVVNFRQPKEQPSA